jgi:hypothetical protein
VAGAGVEVGDGFEMGAGFGAIGPPAQPLAIRAMTERRRIQRVRQLAAEPIAAIGVAVPKARDKRVLITIPFFSL